MSNRNEERLGATVPAIEDSAFVEKQNSNFNFIVPTEFVELPSEGRFYAEGHPFCGKKEIEIKFMTANEEDILTNRSFLKKGIAIDRMLQNILVDKQVRVDDLLIGDKNALIIAARINGYGSDYDTKITCPHCGENFEYSFDLSKLKKKEVDFSLISKEGKFVIKTPKSNVDVECQLLYGKHEKMLSQVTANDEKNNLPSSLVTLQMKMFIVSVNGNEDKNVINQFIGVMPAIDSRFLRNEYQKRVPNINLEFNVECSKCEVSQEVQMPFTADFFWTSK